MMKILAVLSGIMFIISCSNNPTLYNSNRQDIEHLSNEIANQEIDTIAIANDNSYATVYYKNDTINNYLFMNSCLLVMNSNFVDKASPWVKNAIVVGNWISDTSHYSTFYTISLYYDSIPFSATTYTNTIPIDTLKLLMRYLMDSTVLTMDQINLKIPIDSITYINWGSIITMIQQSDYGSRTKFTFNYHNSVLSNFTAMRGVVPQPFQLSNAINKGLFQETISFIVKMPRFFS